MKLVLTMTLFTISVLPSVALANCRAEELDETASSCMPGMVWDAEKGTCVEAPSS